MLTGYGYAAVACVLLVAAIAAVAAWAMHVYVAGRVSMDVAVGDATAGACSSGYVEKEAAAGRVLQSMDGAPCQVLRAANATLAYAQAATFAVALALVAMLLVKVQGSRTWLAWLTGGLSAFALVYSGSGEAAHVAVLSSPCREAPAADLGVAVTGLLVSTAATAAIVAYAFWGLKPSGDVVEKDAYRIFNTRLLLRAAAGLAVFATVSRLITYPLTRRLRTATSDYVKALNETDGCGTQKQLRATFSCVGIQDTSQETSECRAALNRSGTCKNSDATALYALHQPGLKVFEGGNDQQLRALRKSRHLPEAATAYANGVGATLVILGIVGGVGAAATAFAS